MQLCKNNSSSLYRRTLTLYSAVAPTLMVGLLAIAGCGNDLERRLEYSKTTIEKLRESSTSPFYQELYTRKLTELETYGEAPGSRPALLAAGLLEHGDYYMLVAYWTAPEPMVTTVVVVVPESAEGLELQVPEAILKDNREEALVKGVVCYGSWTWKKDETPELLLKNDARITLTMDQQPEWRSQPMELFRYKHTLTDDEEE